MHYEGLDQHRRNGEGDSEKDEETVWNMGWQSLEYEWMWKL